MGPGRLPGLPTHHEKQKEALRTLLGGKRKPSGPFWEAKGGSQDPLGRLKEAFRDPLGRLEEAFRDPFGRLEEAFWDPWEANIPPWLGTPPGILLP